MSGGSKVKVEPVAELILSTFPWNSIFVIASTLILTRLPTLTDSISVSLKFAVTQRSSLLTKPTSGTPAPANWPFSTDFLAIKPSSGAVIFVLSKLSCAWLKKFTWI